MHDLAQRNLQACKNVILTVVSRGVCDALNNSAMCESFSCHVLLFTLPLRASSDTSCHTLPLTLWLVAPQTLRHGIRALWFWTERVHTQNALNRSVMPCVNLRHVTCFFWHSLACFFWHFLLHLASTDVAFVSTTSLQSSPLSWLQAQSHAVLWLANESL